MERKRCRPMILALCAMILCQSAAWAETGTEEALSDTIGNHVVTEDEKTTEDAVDPDRPADSKTEGDDNLMGPTEPEPEIPPADAEVDLPENPEPEKPAGPKLLTTPKVKVGRVADTGKPKISWGKVKGADQYRVYYSTSSDGTYKRLTTTSKLIFVHKKAIAAKRYYYRVQAVSKTKPETNSERSVPKTRVCDFKRPVCTVELNKSGKPKLSWKAIKYADKYEVYRALKKNGTYKKIATVSGTTYTHKKAEYHKDYYYKITAVDNVEKYATSAKSKACTVYTIDLRKKLIALTFDDGPGPYTKAIVNCLKKNQGRATFYVLGQRVESYPEAVKAIHAGKNEIGNHTYNHPMLYDLSAKQIRWQMNRTDNLVKEITGIKPATMRPPGGGVSDRVRENVGKPMILWSIDTRDWEHRNAEMTVRSVLNNAADGDIVLMHDIHEPTKEAALELIPKLRKKGFELVTVSELAKYKGIKLKKGNSYYYF